MLPCAGAEAASIKCLEIHFSASASVSHSPLEHSCYKGNEAKPSFVDIIEYSGILASHCRSLGKRVKHPLQDNRWEYVSVFSNELHTWSLEWEVKLKIGLV